MSVNIRSLIEAKMRGQPFSKILHAVRSGRGEISSLPEDQLDFLESMLQEIKTAVPQFEEALRNDDLPAIKEMAKTFQEIFVMVEDSCESNDQKPD